MQRFLELPRARYARYASGHEMVRFSVLGRSAAGRRRYCTCRVKAAHGHPQRIPGARVACLHGGTGRGPHRRQRQRGSGADGIARDPARGRRQRRMSRTCHCTARKIPRINPIAALRNRRKKPGRGIDVSAQHLFSIPKCHGNSGNFALEPSHWTERTMAIASPQ